MKIKLNLNIFLFLILFLITNQIEIYGLVMVFALIHELAHLICGVLLGFKPDTLQIMAFGFSIEFETKIEDYNKKIIKSNVLAVKKILIAFAGPLVNFIILIIGLIFNIDINIIYANLIIFIFNLLPIYPLDGGRVLINIFKIIYGNRKANKYINTIRIQYACSLPEQGITSVKDISTMCGYSDSLYFSKVFKRKMGLSPKEYIEAKRK